MSKETPSECKSKDVEERFFLKERYTSQEKKFKTDENHERDAGQEIP